MTACLYELCDRKFTSKHAFATALEFGTYGNFLLAQIRSLRLYFPAKQMWHEKAIAHCRQAFEGILSAYEILTTWR